MPTEYYIWKWADNDGPGQPAEVVEELCAGARPPSVEPFLVRKIYPRLVKALDPCRSEWSEILVDPQVTPTGEARFIRFRHPLGGSHDLENKLLWAVWDAELTLYNATAKRLIGLPKRNIVEFPGGRQFVDITVGDIPVLLHELSGEPGLSALTCYDKDGNMFQVWAYQRRYAVEWQVLPVRDFNLHRIWVAGRVQKQPRRARLGTVDCGLNLFAQELLGLVDVHRLWKAFLQGVTRPTSHVWRDVTRDLDKLGQPPRHRHQQPEQAYPGKRFFGQN